MKNFGRFDYIAKPNIPKTKLKMLGLGWLLYLPNRQSSRPKFLFSKNKRRKRGLVPEPLASAPPQNERGNGYERLPCIEWKLCTYICNYFLLFLKVVYLIGKDTFRNRCFSYHFFLLLL